MKKSPLFALLLLSVSCSSQDVPTHPGGKADDAECGDAEPDAKGVCRHSDGRFAPKDCCDIAAGEPDLVCTLSLAFPAGSTPEGVASSIVAKREVKSKDIESLSQPDIDRIVRAAVHLGLIDPGDDISDAIGVIDKDTLELAKVEFNTDAAAIDADWVRFFADDSEVGALFDTDERIIAEVGSGEVRACIDRADIIPCAGFAGLKCDSDALQCVDVPGDTCDPAEGGKDCGGMCVPEVEKVCGGLAGFKCDDDEFCDFPEDNCGKFDQTGVCRTRPQICTQDFSPVCGCDGVTHGNACKSKSAGSDVSSQGPCVSEPGR